MPNQSRYIKINPDPNCVFVESPLALMQIVITCVLLIGIIPTFIQWLRVKRTTYYINREKISIQEGILHLSTEDVYLSKVINIKTSRPLLYRIFKLSDVHIISSHIKNEVAILRGIKRSDLRKILSLF